MPATVCRERFHSLDLFLAGSLQLRLSVQSRTARNGN